METHNSSQQKLWDGKNIDRRFSYQIVGKLPTLNSKKTNQMVRKLPKLSSKETNQLVGKLIKLNGRKTYHSVY